MANRGILSEPLDVDAPKKKGREYQNIGGRRGLVVTHQASSTTGAIIRFAPPLVVLRDASGRDHSFRLRDGAFLLDGQPIALVEPPKQPKTEEQRFTASGSVDLGQVPARMARASRIFVEGVHDAELLEHVWGDDLRVEGIVVQAMDGMDDLPSLVRSFGPTPNRRLGILLDHLVDGTKETRIADQIDHPDVLICGHPFVDVWQGIRPSCAGIDAWPEVPLGESWKEGVLARIGYQGHPGAFWKQLRNRVTSYKDLEPTLIGAVEQLIDFVAPPE